MKCLFCNNDIPAFDDYLPEGEYFTFKTANVKSTAVRNANPFATFTDTPTYKATYVFGTVTGFMCKKCVDDAIHKNIGDVKAGGIAILFLAALTAWFGFFPNHMPAFMLKLFELERETIPAFVHFIGAGAFLVLGTSALIWAVFARHSPKFSKSMRLHYQYRAQKQLANAATYVLTDDEFDHQFPKSPG